MSALELWLTIVALAAVTLITRAGMLFLPARIKLGPSVQRALRHASPCALAAIVVPDLLRHQGAVDVGFDNLRLYAALVAIVIFLASRNPLLTIASGLLAFTAFRLIG